MVAGDEPHNHFAALPGMFDRTVTLSSAGKTFSVTGWQAGWCIGPATLLKPIQLMLPFVQFCVSTPIVSSGNTEKVTASLESLSTVLIFGLLGHAEAR